MIENPILRGFNPDASAICVGKDYYIATSTFEWYPGICIYHSTDLANWKLVSHPVKKIDFLGDTSSSGLWAPHLSYANSKFWLIVTDVRTRTAFKDTLNYITTCETVDGEWSAPAFVNASGFDPALFHDDDGKKYFMNMVWDYRPSKASFAGITMQEYCAKSNKLLSERKLIFEGTGLGVAEGPQIFKENGYYYLVTAAGGTGYAHAGVISRSENVWGPYESSPHNPLITSVGFADNPLQKSGHVSFLPVGKEWYITHISSRPLTKLGNCVLGRETSLQKIVWQNGWPRMLQNTPEPLLMVESPLIFGEVVQNTNNSREYHFDEATLPIDFQSLRVSLGKKVSLLKRPGWLRLYGNESITSNHEQTLLARRWQSFSFRAETKMEFSPDTFQQMAGLALFYNTENFFYAYKTADDSGKFATINLLVCEYGKLEFAAEAIPIKNEGSIFISVEVEREKARFSYSYDAENWFLLGGVLPADHLSDDYIEKNGLVFTGAMLAICCQDLDKQTAYADFDYLLYKEK